MRGKCVDLLKLSVYPNILPCQLSHYQEVLTYKFYLNILPTLYLSTVHRNPTMYATFDQKNAFTWLFKLLQDGCSQGKDDPYLSIPINSLKQLYDFSLITLQVLTSLLQI